MLTPLSQIDNFFSSFLQINGKLEGFLFSRLKAFLCTDLIFDVEVDVGEKRFSNGNTVTDDNTFAGSQIVQIDCDAF